MRTGKEEPVTKKSASAAKKAAPKERVSVKAATKNGVKTAATKKIARPVVTRRSAVKSVSRTSAGTPAVKVVGKKSPVRKPMRKSPSVTTGQRTEAATRKTATNAAPKKAASGRTVTPSLGNARTMEPEGNIEKTTVHQPAATFDPTPDTVVPPRGQTSLHGAQSERAAAQKGQRARMGNRRTH